MSPTIRASIVPNSSVIQRDAVAGSPPKREAREPVKRKTQEAPESSLAAARPPSTAPTKATKKRSYSSTTNSGARIQPKRAKTIAKVDPDADKVVIIAL
jgi:hypothetical protein